MINTRAVVAAGAAWVQRPLVMLISFMLSVSSFGLAGLATYNTAGKAKDTADASIITAEVSKQQTEFLRDSLCGFFEPLLPYVNPAPGRTPGGQAIFDGAQHAAANFNCITTTTVKN